MLRPPLEASCFEQCVFVVAVKEHVGAAGVGLVGEVFQPVDEQRAGGFGTSSVTVALAISRD